MKTTTKLLAALLVVAMMTTLLASCGGSLIGKWAFGAAVYEFKEDNQVSISVNGLSYNGTYETEGKTLTVHVSGLFGETTKEFTYALKGDKLTLNGDVTFTNSGSVEVEFTKQ